MMKFTTRLNTAFIMSLLLLPLRLGAHPHSWITLRTELVVNEKNQLTELHEYWEFDIYYSTTTVVEIKNKSDELQTDLDKIAKNMINNLKSYHYFSELEIENIPVVLNKPTDYSLKAVSKNGQQYLTLYMRFELEKPQTIEHKTLLLSVFDPSYYIDMSHTDTSDIVIQSKNSVKCSTHIELPEPSYELIDYASNLDITNRSTQGLGTKFSEKVFIKCL